MTDARQADERITEADLDKLQAIFDAAGPNAQSALMPAETFRALIAAARRAQQPAPEAPAEVRAKELIEQYRTGYRHGLADGQVEIRDAAFPAATTASTQKATEEVRDALKASRTYIDTYGTENDGETPTKQAKPVLAKIDQAIRSLRTTTASAPNSPATGNQAPTTGAA